MYLRMYIDEELSRFLVCEDRYVAEFRKVLDKGGAMSVGTYRALPSVWLEKTSPISFKSQYARWIASEHSRVFDIAMEEYPYPVAYFAFMVTHSFDNDTHRLQLLRSLWEAVIQLLFTLVLEEFRSAGLAFKSVIMPEGNMLKSSHCRTDSLGKKIDITRCILRSVGKLLPIASYVIQDEYVFDRLFLLNRERNDMQHGYAMGDQQSSELYARLEETVREVLYDLRRLSDIRCLRFRRVEGRDTEVYAEYKGFSGMGKDVYF